jgi:hypothetical protein
MEFEFITRSGKSYLFWIRKAYGLYDDPQLILTTRPHGYIFTIRKVNNENVIDWDRFPGRKEKLSQIEGYVEHLEKIVKLMVFI